MSRKHHKKGNGKGWQKARPKYQNGKKEFPMNPQKTCVLPVFHRRSTGGAKNMYHIKPTSGILKLVFLNLLKSISKKRK